jgi:hypothetical protein
MGFHTGSNESTGELRFALVVLFFGQGNGFGLLAASRSSWICGNNLVVVVFVVVVVVVVVVVGQVNNFSLTCRGDQGVLLQGTEQFLGVVEQGAKMSGSPEPQNDSKVDSVTEKDEKEKEPDFFAGPNRGFEEGHIVGEFFEPFVNKPNRKGSEDNLADLTGHLVAYGEIRFLTLTDGFDLASIVEICEHSLGDTQRNESIDASILLQRETKNHRGVSFR